MAKAQKKESTLTLEEKLAQALVPESEQPYKVPKNWCWTTISNVSKVISKGTTPSGGRTAYVEKGIAFLRVENLNDDGTITHNGIVYIDNKIHCEQLKRSILMRDDVLVSIAGTLGKTGIVREIDLPINTNQAIAFVRLHNSVVLSKYVKYLLDSPVFKNLLVSKTKVTSIPNLTLEIIGDCVLPLPPFCEQQRIVERIESLFAKLDEAKEKLQEVLDGFETRKAAILHKAFTGELTAKWREEHGVSLDSWEKKKIKDVCIPRAGYAFDSKKFCESGYQVLRMGNLYAGELDLSRNPVFIDVADVNDDMLAKAKINDSDVLLTLTGTKYKRDYGYAVKVTEPVNLLLNQRILCLTPNNINGDYFLHYLRSKMFRDIFFSNETGGVNQGNVSSKFVENIEVTLPCGKEQNVIAQKLNVFIDKYNRSRQVVQDGINQVDFIKKAILARAFRGELGTNDENDECAVELLKKVL